jgi:hypothetical protein
MVRYTPVMRIVSLLPSATEIVCALGLGECLVARSHECDYPPEIQDRPVITYSLIPPDLPSHEIDRMVSETLLTHATLYGLDVELLQQLDPDLLITQALCDVCAVSFNSVQEAVAQLCPRTRVLNLEPTTLQGRAGHFSAGRRRLQARPNAGANSSPSSASASSACASAPRTARPCA